MGSGISWLNLLNSQVSYAANKQNVAHDIQASNRAVGQIRAAAAAVEDAFHALSRKTSPVYSISMIRRRPVTATLSGSSARLAPINGNPSVLQTTQSINTQTSTARSSSSALELDLTTAVSELYSAALGLDLTSPEAASRLDSAALGLDLTSPDAASKLASDQALGLDITSPESASRLDSSAGLGLDLTSPETASTLESSATIGLDVTSAQASSTIASTEDINTAGTSYDPNLTFTSGTSVATLSGVYTGVNTAADATSLEIKIMSDATLSAESAQDVSFQVLDQSDAVLFDYTGSLRAGDSVYLGDDIGLSVSFSEGTVVDSATATSAVSHTPTDVDPDAIFNNADPNLRPRFEGGAQVTAGSFTINGTSIAVLADDSINSVITRINTSGAGVTASFSNDRITLTTNDYSEDNIALADDNSGFLAATKLAAAVTVQGNVQDDLQVFAKTTQFASVTSGSFVVDGHTITVDQNSDTVQSIISKINSSGARVVAAYDSEQDKITLNATYNSEDDVPIGSDTSGFLIAAQLSAGNSVHGNIRDDRQVLAKTSQLGEVTNGSFTINGVLISVDKDSDSLSSIIARINSAGAGVTATLDADANKIRLATVSNSEDLITVAGDTSGFLAATALSSDGTVRGNIRDDRQVLAKTSQLGEVTNGSFTINGVLISVDKDSDSLSSIIARINSASAGVTASFDSDANKIRLATVSSSEDLISLADDTSGFLAAAHLATDNTVRGHLSEDTVALYNLQQFSTVTDGSFVVDGKVINLTTSDTIQSIVSKINSSGARVSAVFNSETNRLSLTTTYNTEDNVPIGDDTSGFLAAAGISPANTVAGNIRDDQQTLSKTAQFGSLSDGSFDINGTTVTVNVNQDTLTTLLQKINGADAGVTASLNASSNEIELRSDSASDDLIQVGNDTSGFLAAAALDAGNTIRGKLRDDQEIFSRTGTFAGVTSGSLEINGTSISVDPDQDTLQTLIGKINEAGAGVTAVYDNVIDKILFIPDVAGSTLSLENDTSGFLSAAGVAEGTVGTHVNADAAFNDTGLSAPLFDPGVTVQAGSFKVNGATIQVSDSDSVRSVLSKITASDAGVTGTYDDASQTLRLTSKLATSSPITIESDTSGFVAAVKLDQAPESTPGTDTVTAFDAPLQAMAEYSDVRSGTLTINGHSNAIDPASTTIRGLVSVLNATDGISATLDEGTGKIRISSRVPGGDVTISDTSGALSALGITEGDYQGVPGVRRTVQTQTGTATTSKNASEVVGKVETAAAGLNQALAELLISHNGDSEFCTEVVASTYEAVKTLVDAGAEGLSIGVNGSGLSVLVDHDRLTNALNNLPNNQKDLGASVGKVLDVFTSQLAACATSQASQQPTLSQTLATIEAEFATLEMANQSEFFNVGTQLDAWTLTQALEAYAQNDKNASIEGLFG